MSQEQLNCQKRFIAKGFFVLVLALFSLSAFISAYGNDGDLDFAFGNNGKVLHNFLGSADDYGSSLLILPDGKVIVAGFSWDVGSSSNITLARLNPDGSFDNTFGAGGKISIDVARIDQVFDAGLSADGKILLAGATTVGNSLDFLLMQLTSEGERDASFGNNGVVTVDFSGRNDTAFALAIQPDGKIILAGTTGTYYDPIADFALVRFLPDGSLDSSFGSGQVRTQVSIWNKDVAKSVVVQPDGKIIAGGYAFMSTPDDAVLVRYNPDGTLDASFGSGGIAIENWSGGSDYDAIEDIELLPDNKIIACGKSGHYAAAGRYNSDGSLDTTFGTNGISSGPGDILNSIEQLEDGHILTSGRSGLHALIMRINSDGTLDSTFDEDGILLLDQGSSTDDANSIRAMGNDIFVAGQLGDVDNIDWRFDMVVTKFTGDSLDFTFNHSGFVVVDFLQNADDYVHDTIVNPDGSLLAIGDSQGEGSKSDIVVAKFSPSGVLDQDFGSHGEFHFDLGEYEHAYSAVSLSDGKILIAGYVFDSSPANRDFLLVCMNAEGSLDQSFGVNGHVRTDFSQLSDAVYAIQLQPDGKIILGGATNGDFALARYNADGSLDSTFGVDGQVTTPVTWYDVFNERIALALQSDNKILITSGMSGGSGEVFATIRYNADGKVDTFFGEDGIVFTDFYPSFAYSTAIEVQDNQNILVAGFSDYMNIGFAALRYDHSGALDATFGDNGKMIYSFDGGSRGQDLKLLPYRRFLLAGSSDCFLWMCKDFAVIRYLSNGTPDSSFGVNGLTKVDFGQDDECETLSILGEKVILGGHSDSPIRGADFALARIWNSNLPPTISLSDSLQDGTVGSPYSGIISAEGGVNPYTFQVISGSLPPGLELDSNTGVAWGTPEQKGSYSFTVQATDLDGATGSLIYTLEIAGACLFSDQFETAGIDLDKWKITDLDVFQEEGSLVLAPINIAARILSAGFAGCGKGCSILTTMQSSGGVGNSITLLGWFSDRKNTIEVVMKEDQDEFVLRQKKDGVILVKDTASFPIQIGLDYQLRVLYDGDRVKLQVNQQSIAKIKPVGRIFGSIGFETRKTVSRHNYVCIQ